LDRGKLMALNFICLGHPIVMYMLQGTYQFPSTTLFIELCVDDDW